MSIERADVEKIAQLAKLQISDEQISEVTGKLSDILGMVDQLQAQNTDDVVPMAHPMDATQRLRPDQVSEANRREEFQAIAPNTESGLYLVPRVIE